MSQAPKKIHLHKKRAELELQFDAGPVYLSAEFLRVHSPSAEVQGHGPGQKKLPLDKQSVQITNIEAQGNYAIKLIFDDGHDSGIYTWRYLRELTDNNKKLWKSYLNEAKEEKRKLNGEEPIKWI